MSDERWQVDEEVDEDRRFRDRSERDRSRIGEVASVGDLVPTLRGVPAIAEPTEGPAVRACRTAGCHGVASAPASNVCTTCWSKQRLEEGRRNRIKCDRMSELVRELKACPSKPRAIQIASQLRDMGAADVDGLVKVIEERGEADKAKRPRGSV
jgi:hypothetical protein